MQHSDVRWCELLTPLPNSVMRDDLPVKRAVNSDSNANTPSRALLAMLSLAKSIFSLQAIACLSNHDTATLPDSNSGSRM